MSMSCTVAVVSDDAAHTALICSYEKLIELQTQLAYAYGPERYIKSKLSTGHTSTCLIISTR